MWFYIHFSPLFLSSRQGSASRGQFKLAGGGQFQLAEGDLFNRHFHYKREGKEYDEMHGLNTYDHHSRFFNPVLPVTPTMDWHAENYYNISPYAQFGNNLIVFVDPDGMDVYFMNSKGLIFLGLKTDDPFDRLYNTTLNADGTLSPGDSFVNINDQNFLNQLAFNPWGWGSLLKPGGGMGKGGGYRSKDGGHYGVTSSYNDAFKLFWFGAVYSDVEWSLSAFIQNKKTMFFVGTDHFIASADTGVDFVFDLSQMYFNVHSHNGKDGMARASGYVGASFGDDQMVAHDYYTRNENKYKDLFIFHPHNQELFYYTPWESRGQVWHNITSWEILLKKSITIK